MIKDQLISIKQQLPSGVALVAVSKFHPASAILEAYDAGQRIFAESRPQELSAKVPQLPADIQWHFIGHLQTNKLNKVVGKVDLIQSVDRIELLKAVNRTALRLGLRQDILFEVNVAAEPQKGGFSPEEVPALAARMGEYPGLRLRGLMAIPPISEKPGDNCKYFAKMRNLYIDIADKKYDNVSMVCLSMGMSDDFEDAIAEGSTMIRVGMAIFGARHYPAQDPGTGDPSPTMK